MPTIYEQLGVPTIINAKGPSTRVSGAVLAPEVAAAMEAASQYCVDMTVLQGRASATIADITGAEAGLVTSGAAAGLLLGTAACVTGLDPGKMNRLPDTRGMKNQVIVPRSHRNFYDHAVRAAGIELVEVGIADRFSGAGVRDTEAWEIEDAITDATAAILYVAQPHAAPALSAVTAAAHRHGVPVMVDAAAQLPPVENLRRFTAEGADLVAYSGGKAIMGPQASGLLCGRRDLIAAAALQNLDLDYHYELWDPPAALIDKDAMPGLPQHGIGRSCKVGKEEIVGLLTALRLFASGGWAARDAERQAFAAAIFDGLRDIGATVTLIADCSRPGVPGVSLAVGDEARFGALELVHRLQSGTPSVHADPALVDSGVVRFDTMCLRPEDPAVIVRRVRELLE